MQNMIAEPFADVRLVELESIDKQQLVNEVIEYYRLNHHITPSLTYSDVTINRQFEGPTEVVQQLIEDIQAQLPAIFLSLVMPNIETFLTNSSIPRLSKPRRALKLYVQIWHHVRVAEYNLVASMHCKTDDLEEPSLEVTFESYQQAMLELSKHFVASE